MVVQDVLQRRHDEKSSGQLSEVNDQLRAFTEADPLVMGLDCIHIAFKIVFNSQNKGILWQSNGSVAGQNLDPLCPPKLN